MTMTESDTTPAHDETVIKRIDDHWMKKVVPVMQYALAFLSGCLLMLLAVLSLHHVPILSYASFLVGTVVILFAHHRFFVFVLSEVAESVFLTNRRVIFFEHRLFELDELREIRLERTKGVMAKKEGFLQNVFNYGTLNFDVGGTIEYVPHPTRLASEIQEMIQLNLQEQSLHGPG